MKVFWARFGAVFWSAAVFVALVALGFQAAATHGENLRLRDRMERLDADIRRRETENLRLRREKAALESDPYAVERELRKGRSIGENESVVPK